MPGTAEAILEPSSPHRVHASHLLAFVSGNFLFCAVAVSSPPTEQAVVSSHALTAVFCLTRLVLPTL